MLDTVWTLLLTMSIKIKIEDFQDWSGIFEEIKRQENLKVFTFIAPDTARFTFPQGKQKYRSSMNARRRSYDITRRRATVWETVNHEYSSVQRLLRLPSASDSLANAVDAKKGEPDSRLTDAARNLTKEEMALLYEDILKPLDIYSILRQRQNQMKIQ